MSEVHEIEIVIGPDGRIQLEVRGSHLSVRHGEARLLLVQALGD